MPAYMHGNLAVEQRAKEQVRVKEVITTKKVYRQSQITMGEKIFLVLGAVVCGIIASVIIYRYALIYQMHSQMKATNDKIMEIDSKISASKHELEQQQSPKRLKAEAAKRGYVPANF